MEKKLFRVEVLVKSISVVEAESLEEAVDVAHEEWADITYAEQESIETTAALIKSVNDLPEGWDKDVCPLNSDIEIEAYFNE